MAAAIASMYPPNEKHPVFYHFKCVEGINLLDMKSVIAYLKVCMAYVAGEISEDLLVIVSPVSTGRKADPDRFAKGVQESEGVETVSVSYAEP